MKIQSMVQVISVFLVAAAPLVAQAIDVGLPGKLTKIDATYRCERKGGGVAFRIPRGPSEPARVWQTDPGEEMGLELEVVRFDVARCFGCFRFEAKLGEDVIATGVTQPRAGKVILNYSLREIDSNRATDLGQFPCVVVK